MYPEFEDTAKGRAEQRSYDKYARTTIRSAQSPDYGSKAAIINEIETRTKGEPENEDKRICQHES